MAAKVAFFVIMGAAVREDGSPSGAMWRRVEGAILLARGIPGAVYLVTGGVGRSGISEPEVMKRLLSENHVPDDRILVADESNDTLSSVIRCAAILKRRNDVASITVCSDRYHVPRCRWLFYLFGIPTRSGRVRSGRQAVGSVLWLYYYLREAAAFPVDTFILLGRQLFARLRQKFSRS